MDEIKQTRLYQKNKKQTRISTFFSNKTILSPLSSRSTLRPPNNNINNATQHFLPSISPPKDTSDAAASSPPSIMLHRRRYSTIIPKHRSSFSSKSHYFACGIFSQLFWQNSQRFLLKIVSTNNFNSVQQ
jgi:hypothetical protein